MNLPPAVRTAALGVLFGLLTLAALQLSAPTASLSLLTVNICAYCPTGE